MPFVDERELARAKQDFAKTKEEMKIHFDRVDGVHRYIRVRNPKSNCYWFDVVTWPGTLCINGDMGCYVFCRTHDMFEFFNTTSIDFGYWAEKVVSDRDSESVAKYSPALFHMHANDEIDDLEDDEVRDRAREFLKSLDADDSSAIQDFMSWNDDGELDYPPFGDFWDHTFKAFTYHFCWNCLAIQWVVRASYGWSS